MQRSGYTFEQAERNSVFDLTGSFDVVERMLAEALDDGGTGLPRDHVDIADTR